MFRNKKRNVALSIAAIAVVTGTAATPAHTGFAPARADSLWLVTGPEGNTARYRVREQLVGLDLPNDAVGTTGGVTGAIIIGADGKVSPNSKFVVDVKPLKSDQTRRDGFVQNRLLETAKYPTVDLAVYAVDRLTLPLPASGPITFQLRGNLTVKGVTKPTVWQVSAQVAGTQVNGTAVTAFTFEDFSIAKPRVASVLSVADTIKLEYDFRLIKK